MYTTIWVGNGNQFQYSCLENSMDRAWWATVHGAARTWTQLEHTCTFVHLSWVLLYTAWTLTPISQLLGLWTYHSCLISLGNDLDLRAWLHPKIPSLGDSLGQKLADARTQSTFLSPSLPSSPFQFESILKRPISFRILDMLYHILYPPLDF